VCEETKSKVQALRWVQICEGPLRTQVLLKHSVKRMPLVITPTNYKSKYTGLLKMIARALTTCHIQYTWDRSICIFYLIEQHSKFMLHALQVLYMCTHCDSTNINTIIEFIQNAFSRPFAAILVNCAPSGEMHNYYTLHIIKENFKNFLIHRCNYILLSQVYCLWQVVKTLTIILNNPVLRHENTNAGIIIKVFLFTNWCTSELS
jgi:hypothetical protein